MLIVTRKMGQGIRIELSPGVDPNTPIGDILGRNPIEVTVAYMRDMHVRLGVNAHPAFLVLRDELVITDISGRPVRTTTSDL